MGKVKQTILKVEEHIANMDDETRQAFLDYMEMLINKFLRPMDDKYMYQHGKADAYNNMYKLFDQRADETDDFVSLKFN
jgi:hypothetical protein